MVSQEIALACFSNKRLYDRVVLAMRCGQKSLFDAYLKKSDLFQKQDVLWRILRDSLYLKDDYYMRRLVEKTPKSVFLMSVLCVYEKETVHVTLAMDICNTFSRWRQKGFSGTGAESFLNKRLNFILKCGVDPNAETVTGKTPLISAVLSGSAQLTTTLLKWGADPIGGAFFRETQFKGFNRRAVTSLIFPKNAYEWAILSGNPQVKQAFDGYLKYQEKIKLHQELLNKQATYIRLRRRDDRLVLGGCALAVALAILGCLSRCCEDSSKMLIKNVHAHHLVLEKEKLKIYQREE